MSRGTRGGVRLTAGRFKGRRVPVPERVRPTEGRVREALMSRWATELEGARLLDLFAGSGAVGLEALGRGAVHVTLVDRGAAVIAHLKRQVELLGASDVAIQRLELPGGLVKLGGTYDLIFADPPYAFSAYDQLMRGVAPRLGAHGELVIEHGTASIEASTPATLQWLETRRYGDCRLSFFRPASA